MKIFLRADDANEVRFFTGHNPYKAIAATPSTPNKTGSAHPSILPALRRRPERVVGIPNVFATLRFAFVTPNARFQLKDNPGIFSFFGILVLLFQLRLQRSYSEG